MDLEDIMLNKISQMEKDKYHKISLMCEIFSNMNKPNQTNVYIHRKEQCLPEKNGVQGEAKWVKGPIVR